MPTYRVTGDLLVAFSIEVEADSEEEAEDQVREMSFARIRDEGDVDSPTAGVEVDSCEEIKGSEEETRDNGPPRA